MTTITQKKKKSTLLYAVILTIVIVIVVVAVLAWMGTISLAFIETGLIGYSEFGAVSVVNSILIIVGPFVLGALFYYVIKKYFIGEKVSTTMPAGGYSPVPTYPSAAGTKDSETTIS